MLTAEGTVGGFRGWPRRILVALKKAQPLTVKDLASEFKITPNALRRHLKTLESHGAVEYRREVRGVGGPTFAYSLSSSGEALFPRAYVGALSDALQIVRAERGTDGVIRIFQRQWSSLADAARARMNGLSLGERAAVLAELRTAQGYMAEAESQSPFEATIREHNCAIRDIAAQFPEVCAAEERFFADLLGASVEREAHILNGCNACEYRVHAIVPAISPRAKRWKPTEVEEKA